MIIEPSNRPKSEVRRSAVGLNLSGIFSRLIITLSLEGNTVRIMGCKGGQVQFWMGIPFDPALLADGIVSSPLRMGQIIGTAFRNRGIPTQGVISSVNGYGSQYKAFTVPRVAGNLEAVVARETRRQMGDSIGDKHVVWQSLGIVRGGQERLFAVAIPRLPIEMMVETLQAAGIPPQEMDLKPLALARLVGVQEGIVANIENNSIDTVYMREAAPVIIHSEFLPELSEDALVARLIALVIQTEQEASEVIPTTEARKIWLTGDLARVDDLERKLESAVGCSISPISTNLRCPSDLPVARFAVNLGLALRKLS
jgi:Tfp pilus assembly PilM family ATPase